jgi:hypothetical protein
MRHGHKTKFMNLKNFFRRILRNYKRKPDSKLLPFAQNVHKMTSASTILVNPTPTMATLLAAITAYSDALTAALNRDRQQVALKNTAKATLVGLLDELADFVTLVAKGSLDVILDSGFDPNKIPGTVIIDTPILVLKNGPNPGELITIAENASNAKGIVHEITPDPITENSVWISVPSTKRTHTFTGLPKGVNYWARVVAVGGKNQRMVSLPSSRIVQ